MTVGTYRDVNVRMKKIKIIHQPLVDFFYCIAATQTPGQCHDHDIPPQPSHTYSCPLAVQTPPEHSLTKPEPIPGLPDPSIAFLNSSAAFLKGCRICLVSIPEAVNTIPEHI